MKHMCKYRFSLMLCCWRWRPGVLLTSALVGYSLNKANCFESLCSFESQQAWVIKATRRRHTPPLHAPPSKFQCSLNTSRTRLSALQDSPERQKQAFWSSLLRNDWRALFLGGFRPPPKIFHNYYMFQNFTAESQNQTVSMSAGILGRTSTCSLLCRLQDRAKRPNLISTAWSRENEILQSDWKCLWKKCWQTLQSNFLPGVSRPCLFKSNNTGWGCHACQMRYVKSFSEATIMEISLSFILLAFMHENNDFTQNLAQNA